MTGIPKQTSNQGADSGVESRSRRINSKLTRGRRKIKARPARTNLAKKAGDGWRWMAVAAAAAAVVVVMVVVVAAAVVVVYVGANGKGDSGGGEWQW